MSRIVLHIDMDAFFAAIEQNDHPEFRGKPVIVGADPMGGRGRGVVSTCSYEARVYGIHSAMPINEAWKRCPQGIYLRPRLKRYAAVSSQVMKVLEAYSPDIEQLSIDEAFLDISTSYKIYGDVVTMAQNIKDNIKNTTQLTASIGIAPNKFIAKIASDLKKPDGLVIVDADDVTSFLYPLEISRLWGVGKKTLPRLHRLGIRTFGDLADKEPDQLIKTFGQSGFHFYRLVHGIDDRPIEEHVKAKSISKEVTFDVDQEENEYLLSTLQYLCNELAREMRRKKIQGRTITLKIRLEDFTTYTRSRSHSIAVSYFNDLYSTIETLFRQFDRGDAKVRLIGVSVANLIAGEGQLDLFQEEQTTYDKADQIMDQIRERFGEDAITRASLKSNKRDPNWIRK